MSYIGADDLVTYTDKDGGVYGGGFNVNSVLMKLGISPITTLNQNYNSNSISNSEKVSNLFENLVIPNWAIAYKNLHGSSNNNNNNIEELVGKNYYGGGDDPDIEDDSGDENGGEVVNDDIYNTLLGLVTVDKDGNEISESNGTIGGGKNKKKTKRLLKKGNKNKKTKNARKH